MGEMKKKRARGSFFFISPIYFLAPATQANKFPSAGTDKVPDKCQGGRGVGVDTPRINWAIRIVIQVFEI